MAEIESVDERYIGRGRRRQEQPETVQARPEKRGFNDYFGGTAEREPDLPNYGEQIWYRIRLDGKWVRAIVLDPAQEGLEDTVGARQLHLAIDQTHLFQTITGGIRQPDGTLEGDDDPDRRLAASRLAWRLNVVEGLERGEWQREKPANADAQYEHELQAKAAQVAMRREMAMDGGLTATHRGKMPKAPAWSLGGGVK